MHLEKSCKSIFQIGTCVNTYPFDKFYQVNTCKNTIVHHLKKVCLGAKYLFTIQYTFLSNYLRNSKSFKDSDDIWRQCIAYVLHYYFASIWWLTEPYLQNVINIISSFQSQKHRRTTIPSIWIFPVRHDSIFSLVYWPPVLWWSGLVLYQFCSSSEYGAAVASGVKCQNMTSPKLKAAAAADEKFSYPIKQMDGYKRIQFLSIMII